jgi:hypothetical protein
MPKLTNTSNQNNDNLLNQIHYSLRKMSIGFGYTSTSNQWSKVHEKKLRVFYDIAEKEMLENKNNEHAIFHSRAQWALIDDELRNLKIRPEEILIIEFSIITTESPTIPLLMQIMTYPKMEAVGGILLLTGLLALTAALIALIPAVASALAVISISSVTVAIAGGILFSVGMTLSLATFFCQQELNKDPFIKEVDLTVQQLGFPGSKKSVSSYAKNILLPQFFSMEKAENSSVTIEEVIDEETEADLGLGQYQSAPFK